MLEIGGEAREVRCHIVKEGHLAGSLVGTLGIAEAVDSGVRTRSGVVPLMAKIEFRNEKMSIVGWWNEKQKGG
jgi:hypothetical protein